MLGAEGSIRYPLTDRGPGLCLLPRPPDVLYSECLPDKRRGVWRGPGRDLESWSGSRSVLAPGPVGCPGVVVLRPFGCAQGRQAQHAARPVLLRGSPFSTLSLSRG